MINLLNINLKQKIGREQSWAHSLFLTFLNKNDFLHFVSSKFDWEWAF